VASAAGRSVSLTSAGSGSGGRRDTLFLRPQPLLYGRAPPLMLLRLLLVLLYSQLGV